MKLAEILKSYGSNVFCEDELFTKNEIEKMNLENLSIPEEEIDIVIIHTPNELNRVISMRNFSSSVKIIDPRSIFAANKHKVSITQQTEKQVSGNE